MISKETSILGRNHMIRLPKLAAPIWTESSRKGSVVAVGKTALPETAENTQIDAVVQWSISMNCKGNESDPEVEDDSTH